MPRRRYEPGVVTTLVAGIDAGATSMTITSATRWPTGAGNPFWVTIDPGTASEERVLCTSVVGQVVTISQRGADGTTATSHAAGATLWPSWSATDANEANEHLNVSTPVHSISNITNLQTALDGKAATTHNHDSAYAPVSHTHAFVSQTNGTVTTASTSSTVVRNITVSTSTPSGGADGDVWLRFT